MPNEVETLTVDLSQPPPVAVVPVVAPVVPGFTGEPGNFAKDMAALLAAETASNAPAEAVPAPKVEATQPETTAPATAPATVPEKFKAADGTLDAEKVAKSTVDAEAALAKYATKEKELRQKMNEVARLSQQTIAPNVAPVAPAVNQVPLTAFEIQVANDLINEAAAYGYQMPQGQAIAQARVQVKMAEARHNAEASLTESLRIKLEDQDRRSELEAIAKYDQSVLTPEGFDALAKIREAKPWINQSPKPWTEAYDYYLAEQTKKQRHAGTVQPTPMGQAAKAPPTPVSPAPRVVVQPTGPDLSSKDSIDAHLASLDEAGMAKFFKSQGLRW